MSTDTPNAVLIGDRGLIRDEARLRHVPDGQTEVEVRGGNRMERYRATEEMTTVGSHRVRIFRWAEATYLSQ